MRALPTAIFMTDTNRCPAPEKVISRLPRGTGVIFRDYKTDKRKELAGRLRRLCRQRDLLFLVAGDLGLAQKLDADGLHFPEFLLKNPPPRSEINPAWVVTAAAHSFRALVRAWQGGADAALLSRVFPTKSHPNAKALGIHRFQRMVNSAPLSVYALGGINKNTFRRLPPMENLAGYAGISAFCEKT